MMMMMMIFRIPSSNVDKLPLRRGMLPISGARCKLFPCPRQVMGTYGLKVSGVKMTHHSHNHWSSFTSYSCLWTLDSPFLFPSFQFCQPNAAKIFHNICCDFLPFAALGISQGWSSIFGGLARNAFLRESPNSKCLHAETMHAVVLRLQNWARRAVSSSHASLATSEEMLHPEALPLNQLAVKRVATSSHVPLDIHTNRPHWW